MTYINARSYSRLNSAYLALENAAITVAGLLRSNSPARYIKLHAARLAMNQARNALRTIRTQLEVLALLTPVWRTDEEQQAGFTADAILPAITSEGVIFA